MPNNIMHFAINCNDLERAKRFYEKALGWKFSPWGPPEFFRVTTGTKEKPGVDGAIQKRREIVKGVPMYGFECSVGVEDVDAVAAAVEANGGKVVMSKVTIPTVGNLIFFQDPEGNIVGCGCVLSHVLLARR